MSSPSNRSKQGDRLPYGPLTQILPDLHDNDFFENVKNICFQQLTFSRQLTIFSHRIWLVVKSNGHSDSVYSLSRKCKINTFWYGTCLVLDVTTLLYPYENGLVLVQNNTDNIKSLVDLHI